MFSVHSNRNNKETDRKKNKKKCVVQIHVLYILSFERSNRL